MASKSAKAAKLPVTVLTMEAELSFHIHEKSTGQDLFDMVCHALGLREHWYFGLQFQDPKEGPLWLRTSKKILEQVQPPTEEHPLQFLFLVEFYPEDVSEELVQELTQHLFFLQVRQAILDMDIYCPPEASVLLASYAVQAKYGDYDGSSLVPGMLVIEDLLPQRVIDQYQMTPQMWEERIKIWYEDHRGLSRDDAEMEYLKIAQDLDMYGVSYYQIKNKKNTDVWLGVNALGLNIYESQNKLTPVISFAWSEIRNVSCRDKKFMIKTLDKNQKETMVFYSNNQKMNTNILDLCSGNHRLYVQRRKPDSLEVQQMKQQAKEEKARRQQEKLSFGRERELRQLAESELDKAHKREERSVGEKAELEERMRQLEEELNLTREALMRSEETAELLGQKAELFEEENKLLTQKVAEAEVEITRIRVSAIRTEEEKFLIEQRAKEAEILVTRVVEDSERRTLEMEHLKQELSRARQAESVAKERLSSLATNSVTFLNRYSSPSGASGRSAYDMILTNGAAPGAVVDLMAAGDMNQLSLEIEKERMEYMEKSKHLYEQLKDLRHEIESLKVEEKQTHLDRLHDELVQRGDNKYSTLQKTKAGTTQSRVAFFQDL